MRHKKKKRFFNRDSSNRRALVKNLCISIIINEIVKTTLPKAKFIRSFLEKLVTRAKIDTLHNKRLLLSKIVNKQAVYKLFTSIAPRFKTRAGGYLKILKTVNRVGDCAPMAYVGFVDRFK